MTIQKQVSLQKYNTFAIDAIASHFVEVTTVEELQSILSDDTYNRMPKLILGGGSNLLFTQNFDGLVIKIAILGQEIISEDAQHALIKVGAGVNWHQLVLHTLDLGLGGLENLSLIPGTVGAAPMQNIGAYGVEIKDTFVELQAVEISTGKVATFDNTSCEFGYRYSVFKDALKDRYIIVNVTFKLLKSPVFNITYGAIEDTLKASGIRDLSLKAVSDAVIRIRQSKLPDPAKIGNAGSFFKNPTVDRPIFDGLKVRYADMPGYELPDGQVKVPAGWLIEKSGWKGKRVGNVGVHELQALVLVNYGHAVGNEVRELAFAIQASVMDKFGIALMPEVNMV